MQYTDDRTDEQRETHTVYVGGRNINGGESSYVFWACRPEHIDAVEHWIRKHCGDIVGIYRPRYNLPFPGQCHTYVVTEDHPALVA